MTSYKCEVLVSGHWSGNMLRFSTHAEADRYGRLLLMRWYVPEDHRVVDSTDPVNTRMRDDGRHESVIVPRANDEVDTSIECALHALASLGRAA